MVCEDLGFCIMWRSIVILDSFSPDAFSSGLACSAEQSDVWNGTGRVRDIMVRDVRLCQQCTDDSCTINERTMDRQNTGIRIH